MQCILLLAGLTVISYGVGLLLPGASAILHSPRYHDAQNLMLIRDAGSPDDSVPTISTEQYQLWNHRRQEIFDGFSFYRLAHEPVPSSRNAHSVKKIAVSSANLFDLLGLPIRFDSGRAQGEMTKLILSNEMWISEFGGDPHIFGLTIKVGQRQAVVAGVAPPDSWRLPGKVDAWLLEPDLAGIPGGMGFVVAHLKPSRLHDQWGPTWRMSAPKPDHSLDDFVCSSLKERTRDSGDIFLFAVFLACLALPATTSLPLGEYRVSSRKLSWSKRLRRWCFLVSKLALLLPTVYFVGLDLAHLRLTISPASSEYIQLISSFSICLFGLRWALRDQRQRCPVCLGKLTHPARVGQPSRTFLAWNGTELICISGHGLLHVPEVPTSWFSTQRWLYLDSSWDVLFAEPRLASANYF